MAKKPKLEPAHVLHDSCCNCRFWNRLDDHEQFPAADVIGECRRYPPTVIGIDPDTDGPAQSFPDVAARAWCGEHHRAIN